MPPSNLLILGFAPDAAARMHDHVRGEGLVVIAGGDTAQRDYVLRAIGADLARAGTGALAFEAADPNRCAIAIEAARRELVVVGIAAADAVHAMRALAACGAATGLRDVLRSVITISWLGRLCRRCAEPIGRMSPRERLLAFHYSIAPILRATGCARCCWSGFTGTIPLVQFADADGVTADEIFEEASELVRRGETTIDELARVVRRVTRTHAQQIALAAAAAV